MATLYIDVEHERVTLDPSRRELHRARIAAATERIATAAGWPCRVLRYHAVSPAVVAQVAPSAVIVSGCTTDWEDYDFAELDGLLATIRAAPVPLLGICGGHQLIGFAHGARWGPLGPLTSGEIDPDPRFAPGQRKERGFLPVQVDAGCALFHGMDGAQSFFQSHYWQLEDVPAGFTLRATSPWSRIQAIERIDRPVFGVQFHLERFDSTHRAGEAVLRNFFAQHVGERAAQLQPTSAQHDLSS